MLANIIFMMICLLLYLVAILKNWTKAAFKYTVIQYNLKLETNHWCASVEKE